MSFNLPLDYAIRVKRINGCAIWTGSFSYDSPALSINGRRITVKWELFEMFHRKQFDRRKGTLENTCGNKKCVLPEHHILISTHDEYIQFHRQRVIEKMIANSTLLDDGCRIWNGTKDVKGYGQFHIQKRCYYTHRAWYMLTHPDMTESEKKLHVLHNCKNKSCFIHSRLGTPIDNAEDRVRDGTCNRGTNCYRASITEETAKQIYALARRPHTRYADAVAHQFNTTKSVVLKIWGHVNWCHVTCPEKVEQNIIARRQRQAISFARTPTKEDYEKAVARLMATCTLDSNGCLQSSLRKDPKGYTCMSFLGKMKSAHIIVAECFLNDCKRIPKGKEIAHSCKGKCVLTSHLRIATHKENMIEEGLHRKQKAAAMSNTSTSTTLTSSTAATSSNSVTSSKKRVREECDESQNFADISPCNKKHKSTQSCRHANAVNLQRTDKKKI